MPRIKPPRNGVPLPMPPEEHTPPTEAIEIELTDDTSEGTEVDLSAQPERQPEPQAVPAPAPQPEPPVAEENPLQKALDAQKRAEDLQREAQRQRDEAIRRAADLEQDRERERSEREDAEFNSVLTAISAEQTAADKAESDYAAAMAAQDWGAAAKAQRVLSAATARLDRLEDGKKAFETRREARPEPQQRTQPIQQTVADPVDRQISGMPIPDGAKDWLRNHRDYLTDPRKNSKLQAAHWDALDDAGGDSHMGSQKYLESLETRLGLRQAAPPAPVPQPEPQPQPQRRSMPVSAPVSRDVPASSGQRQTSSKITLTAEERQIAHSSFTAENLTNAEKERLYALGKKRMNEMKANGTYGNERQ